MNATDKKSKAAATTAAPQHEKSTHTDGLGNDDESRVSEEPAQRLWSDGLILLLHIILPIAITGAIIGRKAIFARVCTHLDKSFIAVFCPSFSKREKLKKWMIDYLPNVDGGLAAMWKDGSLMCTLINSVVPGACPNPHRHWKKPPIHGQALAYKYLGVIPVFSETDFHSLKPTTTQEKLLIDYVCNLQAAIEKMTPQTDITFSTRYIARGMGLVTGEQHRKTVIYIYPNFKGQTLDDLLVNIRGPYNTYGSTTLKALSFTRDKNTKLPDKRQSFLKSLSADFSNLLKPKDKGPACDIEIKTEFEKERAKLVFVPNNSGVYEICLTTNGEHIAGSPFNLSIEKNRSGITQNLNDEDVKPRTDSKSIKKKVLNTVIYYEKLRKSGEDAQTGSKESLTNDNTTKDNNKIEEKCQISLSTDKNFNTTEPKLLDLALETKTNEVVQILNTNEVQETVADPKATNEEEYTLPILETLEKLNELLESTEKLDVMDIPESQENYGLNIIDTLRNIPELKNVNFEIDESGVEMNNEINEMATNDQNRIKEIETIHETKNIKQVCSYNDINAERTNNHDMSMANKEPAFYYNELLANQNKPATEINKEITEIETNNENNYSKLSKTEKSCLEDSGTYVNDDIDPDSLSSSVELQGSSEEISFSGGSGTGSDLNENEVNNNDIMVKSNEDICYLILNQNTTDRHKRVYSKDFISCKDEQSKDDLSKSDPNLHSEQATSNDSVTASALSQDNVQEAHDATMASRMFKQHPQEGQCIAGTRSHSYSHGSLLDTSSTCTEGYEFKEHFLRRKAFWANMSMSNMSLAESADSCRNSRHTSCSKLDANDVKKLSVQHPIVRNLTRSESAKNLELRSRSLDFVRQRKKVATPTREAGRFGSVDDLNFPSVRHRREMYLNEQRNQTPSKSLDKQELYAVRGEKYTWSIHEKIKSFEMGSSASTQVPNEKLPTLPENITITSKIKQRFEKAHTYFKDLESNTDDTRRYSLDAESIQLFDSETTRPNRRAASHGNTIVGLTSFDGQNDPAIIKNNELQMFLKERRRRRQAHILAADIFN
ncbi:uncharacterized protein [Atheta coriaria]|uniref:uncharacterized protein isoform X2 n=1 Tax=Dalotia coriaria TaxID=877792 RepID=UPI0031F39E2C